MSSFHPGGHSLLAAGYRAGWCSWGRSPPAGPCLHLHLFCVFTDGELLQGDSSQLPGHKSHSAEVSLGGGAAGQGHRLGLVLEGRVPTAPTPGETSRFWPPTWQVPPPALDQKPGPDSVRPSAGAGGTTSWLPSGQPNCPSLSSATPFLPLFLPSNGSVNVDHHVLFFTPVSGFSTSYNSSFSSVQEHLQKKLCQAGEWPPSAETPPARARACLSGWRMLAREPPLPPSGSSYQLLLSLPWMAGGRGLWGGCS